ncbi:MAG: RdgB/HAM1 family non-canonical purine NTP pyrophosphatase [Actinomycetota bacterium]|nr:RdgB/HAM1 family non-canonical purine NTP pyrophosphatase [Actinomycetota bacterium]
MRLVLASANADKAAEIQELLAGALGDELELVPRPDWVGEVDETGEDFLANARLKAEALVAATGMAAVADDSGLEVDALDGAPGVHSARYAGEAATYADNVAKLLAELSGSTQRTARFHTVALVRFPDGREVVAEGRVEGAITHAPRGEGGFGYDPVFVPEGGDGRTFGELSPLEKHAVSARGRAFRALAEALSAR